MKVIYMSHRYHTNQTTIMKGWKENGHEVRFLSQYAGKIEDYKYIKPIVVNCIKLTYCLSISNKNKTLFLCNPFLFNSLSIDLQKWIWYICIHC